MMIGNFNRRVTLQNSTITKSASGGTSTTWAAFSSVWAMVKHKDSKPVEGGAQTNLNKVTEISIRYSSVIKTNLSKDTRIVVEGAYYAITGLEAIDKDYVVMKCETLLNSL